MSIELPSAIAAPAILARSILKSYPTRSSPLTVLREVDLRVEAGQAAVILGPSGSGKSMLLSILGTLETPTGGELLIAGTNPFALSADELAAFRNRNVGFVFQDHHLLPQLSALENVILPTLAGGGEPDARLRAEVLLELVGLAQRADHRPGELSGGERQRVALARALINHPAILLADEPTGNLDRKSADNVADLLLDLPRREQAALVVVTHSLRLAQRIESKYELVDGRLEALGGE
ncbi:MAG: ABC transporter ATP-binding protein [Planctomycetes bacterium]|nr:ABC transporter ATP-binding protein [Planctomycetota bacterium]